ncbi:MAG: GIY-YIG nuclease family protein [Dehalococcoidia bacterium]|nr:GIY-YIG nuclease family protein [Dehalococcoidia bacterium]
MKLSCVYILANKPNGTLYIGVTSNLVQRVRQHRNDVAEGFTKRYGMHRLIWHEVHETMDAALTREKALTWWKRACKIRPIEESNPTWTDLYDEVRGQQGPERSAQYLIRRAE